MVTESQEMLPHIEVALKKLGLFEHFPAFVTSDGIVTVNSEDITLIIAHHSLKADVSKKHGCWANTFNEALREWSMIDLFQARENPNRSGTSYSGYFDFTTVIDGYSFCLNEIKTHLSDIGSRVTAPDLFSSFFKSQQLLDWDKIAAYSKYDITAEQMSVFARLGFSEEDAALNKEVPLNWLIPLHAIKSEDAS
jgi:hypothetical protein